MRIGGIAPSYVTPLWPLAAQTTPILKPASQLLPLSTQVTSCTAPTLAWS
jgi:hypothetical protein